MTGTRKAFLAVAALSLLLSSCGLFEELYGKPTDAVAGAATVDISVDVPFPIALGDAFADVPAETPSGTEVGLPELYIPQDLEQQLPSDVPTDRIDRIELRGVSRMCTSNTLTVNIQEMELRIGGPNDSFETATVAATLPALPAGQGLGTASGTVDPSTRAEVGSRLASLRFGLGVAPVAVLGDDAPAGQADCTLTLDLRIVPRL